jgi:hypothetical protein
MTIEWAAIATGAFLVMGMIWFGNTLRVVAKRLSEIEANLGETRVGVSCLIMSNMNSNAKASRPEPKPIA